MRGRQFTFVVLSIESGERPLWLVLLPSPRERIVLKLIAFHKGRCTYSHLVLQVVQEVLVSHGGPCVDMSRAVVSGV